MKGVMNVPHVLFFTSNQADGESATRALEIEIESKRPDRAAAAARLRGEVKEPEEQARSRLRTGDCKCSPRQLSLSSRVRGAIRAA